MAITYQTVSTAVHSKCLRSVASLCAVHSKCLWPLCVLIAVLTAKPSSSLPVVSCSSQWLCHTIGRYSIYGHT